MGPAESAHLRSLYRLTLRAISASVLHQPSAARNMRLLYRPIFEDAATRLADPSARDWKAHWTRTLDETLDFLYSSAVSKSLAHKAIRNVSFIIQAHLGSLYPRSPPRWDPQKPLGQSITVTQKGAKLPSKRASDIALRINYGLGEVVKMAEFRGGISLGRLRKSQ